MKDSRVQNYSPIQNDRSLHFTCGIQDATASHLPRKKGLGATENGLHKTPLRKGSEVKAGASKFAEGLEMLPRWSRAVSHLSKLGSVRNNKGERRKDVHFPFISLQSYAKASAASVAPSPSDSAEKGSPSKPLINLDKMFWSKPCSLALPLDSPLRIEEPQYEGVQRFIFKMMLFYSKQSKSIRAANVIYRRIITQVDRPAIYEVFNLEKTFKMTFSLLVLHMWLCLRRLKQEGKEGTELGQYLYEIYNHDVELRVSKAGVNLMLTKWMKELEKIFYGNIVAYDLALLPEAMPDELKNVIWRNVFADDGTSEPDKTALPVVQAMTRYVRREVSCFSLTDKEAMFSGNFMFSSLGGTSFDPARR